MENSYNPLTLLRKELEVSKKRIRDYKIAQEAALIRASECETSRFQAEEEVKDLLKAIKKLES